MCEIRRAYYAAHPAGPGRPTTDMDGRVSLVIVAAWVVTLARWFTGY